MTTTYHLAVLGDHLGGLAAAALAARRGLRVLLLEHAAARPPLPFALLNAVAGGPDHEPALARYFQELGLAPFGPLGDDRIHFHALSPPLQLCLPRHRVSVHADRTARAWELQREFGEAHRALAPLAQQEEELRARFERSVPQQGAPPAPLALRALSGISGFVRLQALEREAARHGFADHLGGLGLPEGLRAAVVAQVHAVRRRPAAALDWAEGLRALRVAAGGLYRNAAGQAGVLEGLRAVLLARGGDCPPARRARGDRRPARRRRAPAPLGRRDGAGGARGRRPAARRGAATAAGRERAGARRARGSRSARSRSTGCSSSRSPRARRPDEMGDYLVICGEGQEAETPAVLLAAGSAGEGADGVLAFEASAVFPGGAGETARAHVLAAVRSVLPFHDESLAGEPVWRTGPAPRYARERLDHARREARLAAGWRTALFALPPFTFLRNEEYATTPFPEALLSGAFAV